jgi:hypothetical protein
MACDRLYAITGAGACAIVARPQSTKGIAEPHRAAVLARFAACPRYDFFNRANKWRRRCALAHVNC